MTTLAEIRQKHPEYEDLSDQQLAEGLHKKFYSDIPFDQFATKIQYKAANDPLAKLQNPEAPKASFMDRLNAIGAGFNTGVSYLAGLPVDTVANVRDLGKAAVGGTRSLFTDTAPPDWLTIKPRSQDVGSGEYLREQLNKIPGRPADVPRPDDTASRYLAAFGSSLPAAATLRPTTGVEALRAVTQSAVPNVAAQAGAEAFPGSTVAPIAAALASQKGMQMVGDWASRTRPTNEAFAQASGRASAASGGASSGANVSGSVNASIKNPGSTNGFVGDDDSAALTMRQQDVLRRGMDLGMKATPGQATGSRALQQMEAKLESQPMTSGPFNAIKENNQRILARETARAIGEGGNEVSAKTLDNAFERIGKVFEAAKDDVPRQIDPKEFLTKYSAINDELRGVTKGFGSHPLVEDVVGFARDGQATGKQLQSISSKLGKSAYKEMTTQTGDRDLGMGLYQVKDYVDDLLQKGMSGNRAAEFSNARREYRNLMNLTSRTGVVDPSTGNVSGKNLANLLQQKDKAGFLRDKNRSGMYDAARFSKAFGPIVGDSGTATRSPIQGATEMLMRIPYNIAAKAYTAPITVEASMAAMAASDAAKRGVARPIQTALGPTPAQTQYLPYLTGLLGQDWQ